MTLRTVEGPQDSDTPQERASPSLEDSISSFSNTFRQVVDRKERIPPKDTAELEAGPSGSHDTYHDEEPTPQQDDSRYGEPPPAYVESVDSNQPNRIVPPQYGNRPNQPLVSSRPDPSRSVIRHETSSSVQETLTLYDLIDVSTASGSIRLTVNLEDEDTASVASKPGILRVASKSGSIKLNFVPPNSTARRNHHISIESSSGSVSGSIIHGDKTSITTSSGSINLVVSPMSNADVTTLSSFSDHGSQKLTVNDFAVGGKLTNFKASVIASGSPSIKVNLPQGWEGKMHAASGGSGNVKVSGIGLHLEQRSQRDFVGYRGTAKDLLPIEVQGMGSGSVTFNC